MQISCQSNQENPDFSHLADHQDVDTIKEGLDLEEDALPNMQFMLLFTKEGLQEVITSMTPWAERNHGCHTVYIAINLSQWAPGSLGLEPF